MPAVGACRLSSRLLGGDLVASVADADGPASDAACAGVGPLESSENVAGCVGEILGGDVSKLANAFGLLCFTFGAVSVPSDFICEGGTF
jgi:hypothetical protein